MLSVVDEANRIGRKYFKYPALRDVQIAAIENVLAGNDTVVILPTGAGKSACYQIPSIMTEGTVVVFSPLISLMHDQVTKLGGWGVRAARLGSDMDNESCSEILRRMHRYSLLYIAPERLKSAEFVRALSKIDVSFVVVDEAHCIGQMRDFRPAYTLIGSLLKRHLNSTPVMALTATADAIVERDICTVLGLQSGKYTRIVAPYDRPNLEYIVTDDANMLDLAKYVSRAISDGSAIVYVSTRVLAVEIAQALNERGIKATPYHGGLDGVTRDLVQQRFMAGKDKVIVATNAFGMGVDKPDVRLVFHWTVTGSIHDYAQESGRAGRDGLPAKCVLNITKKGVRSRKFYLRTSNPPYSMIEHVWKTCFKRPPRMPIDITDLDVLSAVFSHGGVSLFDGPFMASSIIAALEYSGCAAFNLQKTVHTLKVKDKQRCANWLRRFPRRLRFVYSDLQVIVPQYSEDNLLSKIIASGAAYPDREKRPVAHYKAMRVRAGLTVSEDELLWKHAEDTRRLNMVFEFAASPCKHAFLREVFK